MSASPLPSGSRSRQRPLRSKTKSSSSRMVRPIGSCKPEANRRHVTLVKSPDRPEMSQTSPSKVTAAARPSGKKAMSEKRTLRRQGFSIGGGMLSTTYASGAEERAARVVTVWGQRSGGGTVALVHGSLISSPLSPALSPLRGEGGETATLKSTRFSEGGTRTRSRPSALVSRAGCEG